MQPDAARRSPTIFGFVIRLEDDGALHTDWVSDSYFEVTGYTLDELNDPTIQERMVVPEDLPVVEDGLATLHRGEEWAGEHRLVIKSGDIKWIRWFSHPELDDSGKLVRFEGSGHDVTALRKVESKLRVTDEALKMLDEAVWPILWTTDLDLILTSSTGAGLQLYNVEPGQLVGTHFFESVGSDDPEFPPNAASQRALNGERVTYELEWRGHQFRTVIEPLKDENGEVIGTAGVTVAKDVIAGDLGPGLARGVLEHMEAASDGQAIRSANVTHISDLIIDPVAFTVWKGDHRLQLSPTEFRLLRQLASHPNEALTRDDLLRDVWHHDFMGDSRLVDMAINRLRSKIEDNAHEPKLIRTVRGVGYLFEIPPNG